VGFYVPLRDGFRLPLFAPQKDVEYRQHPRITACCLCGSHGVQYFTRVESVIKGPFTLGQELSSADFLIVSIVGALTSPYFEYLDHSCVNGFAKIAAVNAAIRALWEVHAHLAKHPKR
jgi:hypothetical protein